MTVNGWTFEFARHTHIQHTSSPQERPEAMTFERDLTESMIATLNEEYSRNGGWWRVLADHPDTLIAIRNKYLNVYRNGCSIAQVEQSTDGGLAISVHYKFLLKKTVDPLYYPCPDGSPAIPNPRTLLISSLSDIGDIIYWTDTLGGLEKTGVHRVIRANKNVIDTEIALPGIQTDENDLPGTLDESDVSGSLDGSEVPASLVKSKSSRIDFCAVQNEGSQLWLRFFEAKDYSYRSALRASDEQLPKVVAQLLRYRKKLDEQNTRDQIKAAYERSIKLAQTIEGTNVLGKNIPHIQLSDLERMQVDPVPRLVVFGFDADQKNGSFFRKHMKKLREVLKKETGIDCLLTKGSAKEFTAGIRNEG